MAGMLTESEIDNKTLFHYLPRHFNIRLLIFERKTMIRLFTTLILLLSMSTLKAELPPEPHVMLETNMGEITIRLYRDKSPETVENFLTYVNEGFYNGTVFHRIIRDFMIQGGGYDKNYDKKKTRAPIKNEADNGLKNQRGSVAMARTSRPHSATAQFFINTVNNDFLNFKSKDTRGWGYAVFGEVIKGMEIVDKIEHQPTSSGGPFPRDVPVKAVIIKRAKVIDDPATKAMPK